MGMFNQDFVIVCSPFSVVHSIVTFSTISSPWLFLFLDSLVVCCQAKKIHIMVGGVELFIIMICKC